MRRGKAYRCYCSKERLVDARGGDLHARYDRRCLGRAPIEGAPHVIRLLAEAPEGAVLAEDRVFGRMKAARPPDDAILLKSDSFPTYHLASVVDDHLMGVTLVMRGQEWLPALPLHLALWRAFGWKAPEYAHLPLLLSASGGKLSKRRSDTTIESLRVRAPLLTCRKQDTSPRRWSTLSRCSDGLRRRAARSSRCRSWSTLSPSTA